MDSKLQEEIDATVSQLVSRYKPEKIILFGSVARGEAGPDSDLDFFVIKKDVPHRGVDRYAEILEKIRYHIASDFIVATPDEVTRRLALGDPFFRDVFTYGKVLYG